MSYDRMDNLMDCLNKEAEKCKKEKQELISKFLDDLKAFLNVKCFAKNSAMYKYIFQIREKWEKMRDKE